MGTDPPERWLSDAHGDDLQQIDDIGRATAEALARIGIRTFGALADETPERLSDRLAQAGLRVSLRRIITKNWIGQARQLIDRAAPAAPQADHATPLPQQQGPAWHQFAGFSLFFDQVPDAHGETRWQTRLYHEESGDEMLFDGGEMRDWANWIKQRADLPAAALLPEPPAPESAAPPAQPTQAGPIWAEILDVSVRQAVHPGGQLIARLVAEVSFQLSGPRATDLFASRSTYMLEFYVVDLTTHAERPLCVNYGSLDPSGSFDAVHHTEFATPRQGRYELHTVLTFPPHAIRSYYEGPIINVLP